MVEQERGFVRKGGLGIWVKREGAEEEEGR